MEPIRLKDKNEERHTSLMWSDINKVRSILTLRYLTDFWSKMSVSKNFVNTGTQFCLNLQEWNRYILCDSMRATDSHIWMLWESLWKSHFWFLSNLSLWLQIDSCSDCAWVQQLLCTLIHLETPLICFWMNTKYHMWTWYVTRSRGMSHMSAVFNFDFSI